VPTLLHFHLISVLPTLSNFKVLEHIIVWSNSLTSDKNNLLTPHQSGFHSGCSAHDALLHVTDKWMRVTDKGEYFGVVM